MESKSDYVSLAGQIAREAGVSDGLHHYFLSHRDRLWTTLAHFQLNRMTGRRILEIGPFFSYTPFFLHENRNEVHVLEGTDPVVEPLLPLYRNRGIRIDLLDFFDLFGAADSEKHRLPFAADSFDAISCWETMEHFNFNPVGFVRELRRILKPGGIACVTVPNVAKLDQRLKLLRGRGIGTEVKAYHHYYSYPGGRFLGWHWREYALAELVELFHLEGFAIESAAHLVTFQNRPQLTAAHRLKRLLGRFACATVPSFGSICALVTKK